MHVREENNWANKEAAEAVDQSTHTAPTGLETIHVPTSQSGEVSYTPALGRVSTWVLNSGAKLVPD